jgi:hypothetical protein
MKIVFSMGEVFQEVKFWRWLMNIRTLKVLVFRQFFQKKNIKMKQVWCRNK